MNLPPIVGRMVGDIRDFTDSLRGAGGQAASMSQRVGGSMKVVGLAATGAGAALTAMGEESQQASAQARIAVENTGRSYSEFEGAVDSLGSKMIRLGHDDEAATRAFANLATATQDPQKALDSMGLAADIAAARHISLESAADKLAKAQSGNTKVFKEFGITLKANATEEERAAAMTELTRRVQGQAAAQADTFGNKLHIAKETLANFGEEIGTRFGPAIMVAGPLIGGLGQIIQSGMVPAMWNGVRAAAAWAVSMIRSGIASASAAIPVIVAWAPVILTIAAIAAAAYLLWRNWDTIWGAIKGAAEAVAGAVVGALNWLKDAVVGVVSWYIDKWTALIGFFASIPGRVWSAVSGIVEKLWDVGSRAMGRLKDAVVGGISDVIGFYVSLPGRILDALGNLGSLLLEAGKDLIRGMINGVKDMAGALWDAAKGVVSGAVDKVKGLLGIGSPSKLFMGFGRDTMEGYALGIRREAGGVESAFDSVIGQAVGSATPSAPVPSFGGGGGFGHTAPVVPITVYVNVPNGFIGSPEQLARALTPVLAPAVRDELVRRKAGGTVLGL